MSADSQAPGPATDSGSAATPLSVGPRHRLWMPIFVVGLLAVGLVALRSFPDDSLDPGMANLYSMVGVAAAGVLLLAWFAFFAGLTWRARIAGLMILGALGTMVGASVRRLEFTGSMVPEFDWRWNESREEVLDAFLAAGSGPEQPAARLVAATAEDMPEFRGAERDGVITGPRLGRDWQAAPPRKLWSHPAGGGYSSFAVVGSLAVTIEQRRGDEAVVAYDLETGQQLWEHRYPALFSEALGGDGPRATPTLAEGRVYALGATGELVCLEAATGAPVWRKNVLEENGVANIAWGMSGSPLVVDGLVIVNPGAQKGSDQSAGLVAYDAATGERRWAGGRTPAAYASPMLATLAGQRQVVVFDAEGLAGYALDSGQELWRAEWKTQFGNAAAQPLVLPDDRLYFSTDAGGGVVQVTRVDEAWQAETLWTNNQMKCAYACPVYHEGHVYGLDEGILVCQNVADGKRAWKRGRYGHGQLLLADDLLLILSEQGELVLVEATPEAHRELAKQPALEGKTWNSPVLVRGRALVRNHLEMACFDLVPTGAEAPPGDEGR